MSATDNALGQFIDLLLEGAHARVKHVEAGRTPLRPSSMSMPDWVYRMDNGYETAITPVGLLWLRLLSWRTPGIFGEKTFGKFRIDNLDFLEVLELPDTFVVIIMLDGEKLVNLHDDKNLFPSDSLLGKLGALRRQP